MNGSSNTIGNAFVCKVCEKAGDEEDINIQESMDPGNGVSQSQT